MSARAALRRHKGKLAVLGLALGAPFCAHAGIGLGTRISAPEVPAVAGDVELGDADRRLGTAYARKRGAVLEVALEGSPAELGHQHGRLLYPEMVANEGELYAQFERFVPWAAARAAIVDVSRVRFRHVDRGMSDERRLEIAAKARAFAPDPFSSFLPTYHRFVFLESLYDIALSFEHSPLLGCSSFVLTGAAAADGHVILARNFDFEAGPVFDVGKAVFLVREAGRIPYASVAWPGLVGAVTGMNAEGLALVVHGARAREARAEGEPVVQTMRGVLGRARTTEEALIILGEAQPMVSHMVLLVDGSGDVAVAERAPGAPLFARRGAGKVALTNHFEGPLASDPANVAVMARTSSVARRRRLDEILSKLPEGASVQGVVGVLRDKRGVGGAPLPLGDRRAIDALIATHAVVMDATARVLWVSEGPHLVGRFVPFDLGRLLGAPAGSTERAGAERELPEISADPILASGEYDVWVRAGSPHPSPEGGAAAGGDR